MATIENESIAHLSRLARLRLTAEQTERYASQLSSVLGYVEQLSSVETSAEDQAASERGVTGITNRMQPDQTLQQSVADVESFLAGAPSRAGRFLQVRAVLAGEEEAA